MVYDYIVIGSGFGGSVAGLHLVEKGYKVLILEQGKRYNPEDFPKTNWNIPKYISIPELGFFGFKKLSIYCDNPEKSDDFARVISSGNVHILNGLMKNGQIVTGLPSMQKPDM